MHCLRKHWFVFTVAALVAAGTAGCSKQARRARHLAQADKYYAADQYAEAEVEYQNAMKGGPLNAHARRQEAARPVLARRSSNLVPTRGK